MPACCSPLNGVTAGAVAPGWQPSRNGVLGLLNHTPRWYWCVGAKVAVPPGDTEKVSPSSTPDGGAAPAVAVGVDVGLVPGDAERLERLLDHEQVEARVRRHAVDGHLHGVVLAARRDGDVAAGVRQGGIEEIISPAFAVWEDDRVSAAAGYRDWPCRTAHLSALTGPWARDRGLARVAASAAVAHALAGGLLPQWRARSGASRHVAPTLGFRELGAQASLRLRAAGGG